MLNNETYIKMFFVGKDIYIVCIGLFYYHLFKMQFHTPHIFQRKFTYSYVLPHIFLLLRVINVQCDRDFTTKCVCMYVR